MLTIPIPLKTLTKKKKIKEKKKERAKERKRVVEIPAYEDPRMLQQPPEEPYNYHQCNAAAPGCCCYPLEILAMGVLGLMFADKDPSV